MPAFVSRGTAPSVGKSSASSGMNSVPPPSARRNQRDTPTAWPTHNHTPYRSQFRQAGCPHSRCGPQHALRCEPGTAHKHPLVKVQSSRAHQNPVTLCGSVYRKVPSWCAPTSPPTKGCCTTMPCCEVSMDWPPTTRRHDNTGAVAYLENVHALNQRWPFVAQRAANRGRSRSVRGFPEQGV